MTDKADRPAAKRWRFSVGDFAPYGLIVGAVVLGWQIVLQPLMQRAPVEAVIGLAPGSPMVLRRAAESELAAGRTERASALGRAALIRSPFDVRALRVLGLAEAQAGRETVADDMLTLAGNWSLRDDPAHAWLVERRLRRGDYASSFAHADTLVRRREDIQPQVFQLFTAAATQDPRRSLPVTAGLLAARPPWRAAYLANLIQTRQGLQVAGSLAVALETSRAPFSNEELQQLYTALIRIGGVDGLKTIRARLNRPPVDTAVTNGGFEQTDQPGPFQWQLSEKSGIAAEIVADDLGRANIALRVDYNGYATGRVAEQLILLAPGTYQFSAAARSETGDTSRLVWTLTCATGGGAKSSIPTGVVGSASNTWMTLIGRFTVPEACPAQWLALETRAGDRRTPATAWFDRIAVSPEG